MDIRTTFFGALLGLTAPEPPPPQTQPLPTIKPQIPAQCRMLRADIATGLLVPRGDADTLGFKPVARMYFGDAASKALGVRYIVFSDELQKISIEKPSGARQELSYRVGDPGDAGFCKTSGNRTVSCSHGKNTASFSFNSEQIRGRTRINGVSCSFSQFLR